MYSLIYPQDSKLFIDCQARNEDIDMSYIALPYIYYIYSKYIYLKQQDTL